MKKSGAFVLSFCTEVVINKTKNQKKIPLSRKTTTLWTIFVIFVIKTSKQRSYTQVSAIQKNLESMIQHLFYAVSVYAKIGGIASENAEIVCTWGDSILEDTDKEFQRRLQLVTSGNLKPEKMIAWYFGCSEEEAVSYLPEQSNDGGLFRGDV